MKLKFISIYSINIIVIYSLVFIHFSICNSRIKLGPPCYHNKGIKVAETTAMNNLNPNEKQILKIEFDEIGRPFKQIKPNGEVIKYKYIDKNLKATIIVRNTIKTNEFQVETIDTNYVTNNDEFGRPLKIVGADKNVYKIEYMDCDREFHIYENTEGDVIHTNEIIKTNGLLIKSIFNNKKPSEFTDSIKYFNYKYNSKGHWIEREYEYGNNKIAYEKRELIYYN